MEDIVFQLKKILNELLLKCLRQSKITDFLQRSAFDLCLGVNMYCLVIIKWKKRLFQNNSIIRSSLV